ncbi:MAG: hypothetical protein LBG72_08185 [Spirochaetaceae bacterium]|nr:hypothetical protein [Spirochaetaceae bacterium]
MRTSSKGGVLLPSFIALLLITAFNIQAQQIERFAIYQAKGSKFSMSYDGQVRVYQTEPLPSGGISILRKDRLQTKDGTLELRSYPNGFALLIGDNTELVCESESGSADTYVFTLVYGRIRILNMLEEHTAVVRAGRSVVEIEKGDINIDYAAFTPQENGSEMTLVVSTLQNGALVTVPPGAKSRVVTQNAVQTAAEMSQTISTSKNGRKKKEPSPPQLPPVPQEEQIVINGGRIIMNEGETLFVDPVLSIVEKRGLTGDVMQYWTRRGYGKPIQGVITQAQPVVPADRYGGFSPILSSTSHIIYTTPPAIQPSPAPVIEQMPLTPAAEKKPKKKNRVLGTVTGIVLMAAGAGMSALPIAAPDMLPDRNTQNTLFVGGFIPLGLGLVTLIGTLLQ